MTLEEINAEITATRADRKKGRGGDILCGYRYKCFRIRPFVKNSDAATVKVLRAIFDGQIVPLYHTNQKHYPIRDFIVTLAEMIQILNRH